MIEAVAYVTMLMFADNKDAATVMSKSCGGGGSSLESGMWQEGWWRWLEVCPPLRPDDTLHVQAKATISWFPQINNNSYASREARTEKENLTLRHCKRHRAGGGERLLSGFSSVWASSLLVVLSSFPSANTTTGFNHLLFPSWLIVHNLGIINPLMFDSSAKYQWVTMFCRQSIEDE